MIPQRSIPRRPRNPSPLPSTSFPDSKRLHGRVVIEAIKCSLGEVLDASAAGMRLRTGRKVRVEAQQVVDFTVEGPDGPFDLKGEIMWVKHRGWSWNEIGLRFVEVSPETRKHLNTLAQSAAGNTTFPTSIRLRESA